MAINNKFKNTRVVKFKEDYFSGPLKKQLEDQPGTEPIYKKGSTHYIHKDTVAKLEKKGAKMEVKEFDHAAYVNKSKKQLAKNKKADS